MSISARPRLALAVVTLGLVTYAYLALASGLGRMGAVSQTDFFPAIVKGEALKAQAAQALESQDAERAVNLSRQAVAINPRDAASLGLFGTAALASGEQSGAGEAFALAAQLGWRDLPTQLFWFDQAVKSEEWALAAQRLDAVLRTQPSLPEATTLVGLLELGGPEARLALGKRVALSSAWRARYLDGLGQMPPDQLFARGQILESEEVRSVGFSCAQIAPITGALISVSERAQADRVWRNHCDAKGLQGPIFDPAFATLAREGELPGLGWQINASGDLNVAVQTVAGVSQIEIENVGSGLELVMTQKSVFPVGRFALAALDRSGAESEAFRISHSCGGQQERPDRLTANGMRNEINVPPACNDQLLSLWVEPSDRPLTISRLEVVSAP